MNFGTANFNTEITGKAYMVLTDLELTSKQIVEKTLTATVVGATAKVTLDLDNYFEAWVRVKTGAGTQKTADNAFSWNQYKNAGSTAVTAKNVNAKYDEDENGFIDTNFRMFSSKHTFIKIVVFW